MRRDEGDLMVDTLPNETGAQDQTDVIADVAEQIRALTATLNQLDLGFVVRIEFVPREGGTRA